MPYCKYVGNTFYLDFTGQKLDLISDCPKIAIKTLGQAKFVILNKKNWATLGNFDRLKRYRKRNDFYGWPDM
jgi:hypothetical protein